MEHRSISNLIISLTISLSLLTGCSSSSSSGSSDSGSTSDGLPLLIIGSAIADINGDGKNDIILSNGQSVDHETSPRVYLNEGSGKSFQLKAGAIPAQYKGENATAVDIKIADFNKDGLQDLLILTVANDYQSSRIQLYFGKGDGTFSDESDRISNSYWPTTHSSNSAWPETPLKCTQVANSNNSGPFYLRVTDIDGDSYPDFSLSFGGIGSCGGVIYLNDKTAKFAPARIKIAEPDLASEHYEYSLVASSDLYSTEVLDGDLNGDGNVDFFAPRLSNSGSFSNVTQVSYINTSTPGKLSFQPKKATFANGILHGALLDIDGDGKLDLIGSKAYEGPNYSTKVPIYAYSGDGIGGFTLNALLWGEQPSVQLVREFLTADFNNDSRKDLLILNEGPDLSPFPGEKSWLFLSLNGRLENKTSTHFTTDAANTHQGAVGDIDGDGDIDIIMNNSFQDMVSAKKVSRIWLNDGQGVFSAASINFHE